MGGWWAPSPGSPWVASRWWVALPGLWVPVADVLAGGGPCPAGGAACRLRHHQAPGSNPGPPPSSSILGISQLGGERGAGSGRCAGGLGATLPAGVLSPQPAALGRAGGTDAAFLPLYGSGDQQMGDTGTHHPWGRWERGAGGPLAGSAPGSPRQPVAVPGLVLASVTRRDALSQRSLRPVLPSKSPRPRWAGWGPSLPGLTPLPAR